MRERLSAAARTPRTSAAVILKPALSITAPGALGLRLSSDAVAAPAGATVSWGGALLGVLAAGLGGGGPPVAGEALPVPLHQDVQPHRHLCILDLGDMGHHHGHPAGGWCGHPPPSIPQLPSPAARRGAMAIDAAPTQGRDGRAGSRGAPDATQLRRQMGGLRAQPDAQRARLCGPAASPSALGGLQSRQDPEAPHPRHPGPGGPSPHHPVAPSPRRPVTRDVLTEQCSACCTWIPRILSASSFRDGRPLCRGEGSTSPRSGGAWAGGGPPSTDPRDCECPSHAKWP